MLAERTAVSNLQVEIININSSGEGVGRLGSGKVIFIPFALPGEIVEATVTGEKKAWAKGRLEKVLTPSPHRREPACPLFYSCGGCALQHLEYEKQLEWKKARVEESLVRLGDLQHSRVLPVLGASNPYHYRNKITLHWEQRGEKPILGFYRPGTNDIVETKRCLLASERINEALRALRKVLEGIKPVGKAETGRKQVILRYAFSRDEIMLVFSTPAGLEQPLVQRVPVFIETIPRLASVWHFSGKRGIHLEGKKRLQEKLLNGTFSLGPKTFFQVNPQQAEVLFQEVRSRLQEQPAFPGLADLHCGTGVMALLCADQASSVFGMDSFGPAIEDARKNARANRIEHAYFFTGSAEKILPRLLSRSPIQAALLNPPRQGCSASLVDILADTQVPFLVYVSCNPATLSRDLKRLTEQGYRVGTVQPLDMFPQTPHVECVVSLYK